MNEYKMRILTKIVLLIALITLLFLPGLMPGQIIPPADPTRALGDDCTEPILINAPQDLPFNDYAQSTCGRGNAYDTTCLGSYDDGEDIIYQLVLTSTTQIRITMTPDEEWTAMGLFDDCPDVGNCLETVTFANVGYVIKPMTINITLGAGIYYLMMDSWPAPACYNFDLSINQIVPVNTFPYLADYEDGLIPTEFALSPGADADVRTDTDAANSSDYGLLFEGNTLANWGATPNNVVEAFDLTKSSHFGTVNIEVIPTGEPGFLKMRCDLQQGYSYIPNYCWFRVMVDSIMIPDENGFNYYQPNSHNDPFITRTWDLGAYQGSPFTITLQSSCKYYENYYQQGDVVHIDNFQLWYELLPGSVEGYVFNGDGLSIADASIAAEGTGITYSGPDGYYLLEHVPHGMQEIYAWKYGYNLTSIMVNIPSGGIISQNFILTQPTMIISPTAHNYTLNPNELLTAQTGIQNTGDGLLNWSAEIVYPAGDTLDWLSLDWYEGMISPNGGVENIPTNFNAGGCISGEVYTADIVFSSDPDVGTTTVSCEMTVLGDPLIPPSGLQVTLLNDVTGEVMVEWESLNREFLYYIVKRDGVLIASTINHFTIDFLPDYGEYCYTVQSYYDEGWSVPEGPACVIWPNPQVFINPASIEGWVWADDQTIVHTSIFNLGVGTLTFNFPGFNDNEETRAYCPASGGCSEFIQQVTMDSINNFSGCKNYSNFTNFSTTVQSGISYPISITIGNPYAEDVLGIWVDWDQDEDWDDETMIQSSGDPFNGFTAEIIPPDGIPSGYTRMRIRLQWGGIPEPCGTTQYGEVEDYNLFVLGGFVLDIQPSSGAIQAGESQELTIIYDASGFPAGDFTQQISCETNDPSSPITFIQNTMHVSIPAQLAGNVSDGNTGLPIPGARITAESWQAQTGTDGNYSLYLDEGNYDIIFQKLGYQTVVVENYFVKQGIITPMDMQLYEEPYPVPFVDATVNNDDTECLVEWAAPVGPWEILYDDGEAEELVVWADPYNENAVKFSPPGYPFTLIGGRLFVGDGTFPSGNWLDAEFAVLVYDDDGQDAMPGTLMDSIPVVVDNYGWIEFWGGTAAFTEGDFYISMMQLTPAPDAPPLGVDYTSPVANRSYSRLQGSDWALSPYQDFMIRAYISGPYNDGLHDLTSSFKNPPKIPAGAEGKYFFAKNGIKPPGITGFESPGRIRPLDIDQDNRGITFYEVARISDFDPDIGPETGNLSLIAGNINTESYNDTLYGQLAMGWYAYAVRANYTNGDTADWIYSNTVGHLKEVNVDFTVSLTTGEVPEDVDITMTGADYPYAVYQKTTDTSGFVEFNGVWKGAYTIHAYKVGYELYEIPDEDIQTDMSYSIILGEKRYPPRKLWVDPLSSYAYWDYPIVTAIQEDFDGSQFLPAGWQTLSQGIGWSLTTDGSSANWTIPPWDSQYACANDDAAGSGNNGCCDYLVTPALDLRESGGFSLMFDSYFDAAFGQLAFVEFSVDAGNTWYILHALSAFPGAWDQLEIDLSNYSGANGPYPFWLAFHTDDNGEWASGWAIDNVEVSNGSAEPIDFYMFLDGAFVGSTVQTSYQYLWLTYGVSYEASVAARYTSGLSDKVYYNYVSTYLTPPRNLDGESFDDAVHIWWEPPLEPDLSFVLAGIIPRTISASPYSDYSPYVRTVNVSGFMSNLRDQWDIHFSYPTYYTNGETGAETDGDYLYSTQWNAGNGTFFKYEMDGTYLETFTIPGCRDLRDLAYDSNDNFMFGSNATDTVWMMDFIDQEVVATILAPTEVRAIAYDDDNEALWANNWDTDITMFDLSGNLMGSFPIGTWGSYYGFAYDNWTDGGPYLWGFSQDGSGAVLVQIDINTGTELFSLDVLPVLGGTEIAGGLYTMCSMVYNNKVTIGGLLQNEMLFGLELGPCGGPPIHWHVPDNLIGYKVYRDQDWIASIPYNGEDTSSYYDIGLDPYTFQYDVSALYNLAAYGFPGETGESMLEGPLLIQVQYGYPLPFEETWNSGNFELNQWDHSGNWLISGQSGNPHPSAKFSWFPVLANYKSSLTTYPLDGVNLSNPWIDGCIWLDFDLKLVDRTMSGAEKLGIEVGNDNGWFKVREFDNARGSFDWETLHTDISNYAAGEIFRVRFVAEGKNSSDILSWFVDNIYVYRDCPPPSDLDLEVQNCVDINLTWHSPYVCGSSSGNTGEWLHWDDGTNEGGIGIAGGGIFSVASHWDPAMLKAYENMSISRIRFFAHESAINSDFTVKVWKGENAEILLYEQLMDNVQPGSWNVLNLDSIVPLDITQELWFGYTVDAFAGESPAGHDAGPAIVGYGDMYSTDGIVWEPISGFGQQYDKNWNLQAYLSDSTGKMRPMTPARELLGYNIYVELEYHDFTSDTSYIYTVSQNGTYRFEIFAVYEDCVSDSSIRGMIDIGCVGLEMLSSEDELNIYPIPAKENLYIQAQEDILELTLLDHLGHIIYQKRNTKAKMLKISTEDMVPGFYLLKMETKKSFYSKKVLIIP